MASRISTSFVRYGAMDACGATSPRIAMVAHGVRRGDGQGPLEVSAPHPMLAGVTPTAGGLVFAADLGGQIYAADADTGIILWQSSAGQSTGGGIVTYRAGGRQLIGVASGMKSPVWPGGAQQSRILVYGLR